jgi:nucleoside-diphosphate-sugar epimerase
MSTVDTGGAGGGGGAAARGVVLVTGARGLIGAQTATHLERDGWAVRRFDIVDGDDVLELDEVLAAVEGCDAVVHAAALPHDRSDTPSAVVATNVLGTWHVLEAAERQGVGRVVTYSSIQVFGCSEGEGDPAYLPVDDDHPRRACRPYGMSKVLVEEMCERWTSRTGIPTVLLRPVATVGDERLARLDPAEFEFGAYVHVADVADATVRAVERDLEGHLRLTVSAVGDVDTSRAREALGWEPTRRQTARDRLRRRVRQHPQLRHLRHVRRIRRLGR